MIEELDANHLLLRMDEQDTSKGNENQAEGSGRMTTNLQANGYRTNQEAMGK